MKANRYILLAWGILSASTISAFSMTNDVNSLQAITDSTELVTELDGIVVESSGRQMSTHGVSVIPNTNQKNASYDGYDLVRRLGIPEIDMRPGDESIKTITGAAVATFINYQPASANDVAGLNPKDVLKVEYLQNPMDGRFGGQREVVNFIIKVLDYGGYTRLQANSFIYGGRNTWLSAFSKFYKGWMTYDLYLGYNYLNNHHSGGDYTQWFTLNDESGKPYEQMRRESTLRFRSRETAMPISFKATYNNKDANLYVANTLSYTWQNSPAGINEGLLQFSPGASQNYNYWKTDDTRGQSVAWNGYMNKGFKRDWYLNVIPSVVYSHYDRNSCYLTSLPGDLAIINASEDRAVNAALNLALQKVWQNKYLLGINGNFNYNHNKVDYRGSSPYVNRLGQFKGNLGLDFQYGGSHVYTQFSAMALFNSVRVNGVTDTRVSPEIKIQFNWNPNNFHKLMANMSYTSVTPSISEMSPNILQENEFLYLTGNPEYHSYDNLIANISYIWNINSHFIGTASVYYNYVDKLGQRLYEPFLNNRAILRYPVNSGSFQRIFMYMKLRYTPNKAFAFEGFIRYFHDALEGVNHNHSNAWGYYLEADYYLRNVNFSLFYERTDKELNINTGQFATFPNFYGMNVGWSARGWNVTVSLRNPFKYTWKNSHEFFTSPYYRYDNRTYGINAHCSVQLRVSYTFRYGKQKNDNSEIGAGSQAESGVLK